MTVVDGGSVVGNGIWPWSEWVDRVENAGPGAFAQACRSVRRGSSTARLEVSKVIAEAFSRRQDASPKPIAIFGKHGTGKSVALAQIGAALHDSGTVDVYVVDDYLRFGSTNLARVLPRGDRPAVVLVDDADVQGAFRPTYQAMGDLDLLVIGTFSDRAAARIFAGIGVPGTVNTWDLPDVPSERDLEAIDDRFRPSGRARPRPRALNALNIRAARRIIEGGAAPADVAQQLVDLRPDRFVVALLTWCGAHSILLPSALLVRAGSGAVPAEVQPWLVSRPIFGSVGESHALWLEDRTVVSLAERIWQREIAFDDESHKAEVQQMLERLVEQVDPSRPAERLVARQVLRRVPDDVRRRFRDSVIECFERCISEETDRGSILAWTAAIPVDTESGEVLRLAVSERLAKTVPDLGALVEFVVGTAADRPAAQLPEAVATPSLWADLIELFDAKNGGLLPIEAFRATLTILRDHPDSAAVLRMKNTTQILTQQVTRRGRAQERKWLRDALLEIEDLEPHEARLLIELVIRCIMQERYKLCFESGGNPARADEASTRALESSYRREYERHQENRVSNMISLGLRLAGRTGLVSARTDHLWGSLLRFSDYYARDESEPVLTGALEFARNTWHGLGLPSCQHAVSTILGVHTRRGSLPHEDLAHLFALLESRGVGSHGATNVVPRFVVAAAKAESGSGGEQAAQLIRRFLHDQSSSADLRAAWNALIGAYGVQPGWSAQVDWTEFREGNFFRQLDILGPIAGLLPAATKAEDAERLVDVVASFGPRYRERCLRLALEHCSTDKAEEFVQDGWETDPNWSAAVAQLRAVQGKIGAARRITGRLLVARHKPNPISASTASARLAEKTYGYERRTWQLIARLCRPAELAALPPS